MQEGKQIHLIFNPGKNADVSIKSITVIVGDKIGSMPTPHKKGFEFVGWYSYREGEAPCGSADAVTSSDVADERFTDGTVLFAHWKKEKKARRNTSLKAQRLALIIMAAVIVLLVAALIFVNYLVSVFKYTDFDGKEYIIKKDNGLYALFDKDSGSRCRKNEEGYFQTSLGTLLDIDKETGEYEIYAVVDTYGTEVIGHNRRVLMFKQLTYDLSSTSDMSTVIDEITVTNEYGTYKFKRSDNNRFVIDGYEDTAFDEQIFAKLANGCGYTIVTQRLDDPVRLENGKIDLAEYGLTEETRTKTEYPEDADTNKENGGELFPTVGEDEGVEVEYEYKPIKYTISTMTGTSHNVILGDMTVSGAGYYAMYEGRDTVYILSSSNIEDTVVCPIETFVTPMLVYPSEAYYDVENFVYRSNIDHEAILFDMLEKYIGLSREEYLALEKEEQDKKVELLDSALEELEDEEYEKVYTDALKKHSDIITAFSFIPTDERENQLFSTVPYRMSSEYMDGYLPNSDNIGKVLEQLVSMTYNKVVKLDPSNDDIEKYGLTMPAHIISFDSRTDNQPIKNYVEISEKFEGGVYYAYSPYYDMIVEFSESQATYLEWDELDWYESQYFLMNLAHVQSITVESGDFKVEFKIDNSRSPLTMTEDEDGELRLNTENIVIYANGKKLDYSLTVTKPSGSKVTEDAVYNFRRFYKSLLTASLEGVADLSAEQMKEYREQDGSKCQLKITVKADDSAYITDGRDANTLYYVYRFYKYSERQSYMTLETLNSFDAKPNSQDAQGKFYVLRSFCDKLIADTERLLRGEEIVENSKR